MQIANIDREILHIFWTTWEISMKMWLIIILKVTKRQSSTLPLEDTAFLQPQGGGGGERGGQIDPPVVLTLKWLKTS